MNYQLIKNNDWKEKEINEENKQIPINWSVDTIGKVFKINGGGTPSTTNKEFWDGNIPWLGPKEMSKEKSAYIGIGEKHISELGAKKLGNKKILKDSIIISTRAPVGYLKFAKNDLYTNQGCHSLLPSQIVDNKYMYYWLTKNKYILEKKANGTTFKELSHGSLKSIEFVFPELNNQKLISSILSKQESIISNIENLIEKNEIIFNELSEQLLSGVLRLKENNGKISVFKNLEDNWKEVEINGEIKKIPSEWDFEKFSQNIKFTMGNTPKKENDNYNGDLPWITISNFSNKYISEYTANIKKLKNVKILPKGTLLGSFKMSVGKFAFTVEDCATNEAIIAIKENDTIYNLDFLYYILPTYFIKNAEQNGQGLLLLNSKKINDIDILFPPSFEQNLIANFLKNQERKIENLKSLLKNEKEKFEWLLDNLLSGNYLVKEIEK